MPHPARPGNTPPALRHTRHEGATLTLACFQPVDTPIGTPESPESDSHIDPLLARHTPRHPEGATLTLALTTQRQHHGGLGRLRPVPTQVPPPLRSFGFSQSPPLRSLRSLRFSPSPPLRFFRFSLSYFFPASSSPCPRDSVDLASRHGSDSYIGCPEGEKKFNSRLNKSLEQGLSLSRS